MWPVGNGQQLERRRQRAITLLKEGGARVEVARLVGVDRRSVRRWSATYRGHGVDGLAARLVPGRPWKLSARQRKQLEIILLRGAAASGFESDLWICPRVAQVIRRRFGIGYHVDHSGCLLRSLGWTAGLWNGMRKASSAGSSGAGCGLKKARGLSGWLVFLDERGLLLLPVVRRTWSRADKLRCSGMSVVT